MKIRDAVTAFIMAEPETSFPKRAATILVPRATIGAAALLSLTTVTAAGHGPLPQQLADTLVTQTSELGRIHIPTAATAGVLLYAGEKIVIFIMEKILKPLLAGD